MYARVLVLFGTGAMFLTLQGCSDEKGAKRKFDDTYLYDIEVRKEDFDTVGLSQDYYTKFKAEDGTMKDKYTDYAADVWGNLKKYVNSEVFAGITFEDFALVGPEVVPAPKVTDDGLKPYLYSANPEERKLEPGTKIYVKWSSKGKTASWGLNCVILKAVPKPAQGKAAAGAAAGANAAAPTTSGTKGPSPTRAKAEVAQPKPMMTSGPEAHAQLEAARLHHDAAKMQLEAAHVQHETAMNAAHGLPPPGLIDARYDPYDQIPIDDHASYPPLHHEAYKYLDSAPLPHHVYRDTLSGSHLGPPPVRPADYLPHPSDYDYVHPSDYHYVPPHHYEPLHHYEPSHHSVAPKRIRPKRTGHAARKEPRRAAGDGSHYTNVQINAPAGANLKSTVDDNGMGNVQATQFNYNSAANGATTNVQSGPPHQEHYVDVVKAH